MSAWLDIYAVFLKRNLAIQFQYRVAMLIWLIGMVVEPVMYLVVWRTVAVGRGGAVGDFTVGDFAAYYIIFMVVNHLTFTWIMWEYEHYIRSGTLAALLLKPIHPIHQDIANNIAYKLLTLVVLLPTALILALFFQPTFTLQLWSTLAFIPALLFAAFLHFTTGWALAMAAFWTTRVNAFNAVYSVAMIFFSGRLAPLALFPPIIRVAANATPFPWMASFPIELLLGRLSFQQTLIGFGAQLIWMLICYWLLQVIWQAGIKRFSAVGA